jgi:hypothetical protein
MKKTTLIVLLLAVALGGYVYYSEFRNVKEKPAADAPKPLYTFSIDDITSINVTRPGPDSEKTAPVTLEHGADGWKLTSPITTRADRFAAESLAGSLTRVASSRSLPADVAKMKNFGLDPPAATVEIHLKNGQTQKLSLGAMDFSDQNIYAQQGGAKDVLLVPSSLLTDVTRSLSELRDRTVLQLGSWTLTEMDIRTPKAKLRLEKKGEYWDMTEPRNAPADADDEEGLRNALSTERFSDVVEEDVHEGGWVRYGLSTPEVAVHVRNEQGSEAALQIGKKDGTKYFARDVSRSMVFHVEEPFVKKLTDASATSLRDKRVLRAKADDFTHVAIHNEKTPEKTTISAAFSGGKWLVEEPAERKGKEMTVSRVFDLLTTTRAKEVTDPPSAAVAAKLAKPAVEIKLTEKNGSVTTIVVSAKDGDAIYVRSSRSPAVFKFDANLLDQVNFSAEEAAP